MTHPPGTFSKFPGIVSKREPLADDDELTCFNCGDPIIYDDECVDDKGNPICDACWDKMQDKEL